MMTDLEVVNLPRQAQVSATHRAIDLIAYLFLYDSDERGAGQRARASRPVPPRPLRRGERRGNLTDSPSLHSKAKYQTSIELAARKS